jgi:DNA-binding Xre family transcriptional regulator
VKQTLIKWRLKEVMARHDIKAGDLAKCMGVSHNSVANLRRAKTMPRLDGESLNRLCNALNSLAQDLEGEITPVDLITYTKEPITPTPAETSEEGGQSKLSKSRKLRSTDPQPPASLSAA